MTIRARNLIANRQFPIVEEYPSQSSHLITNLVTTTIILANVIRSFLRLIIGQVSGIDIGTKDLENGGVLMLGS